METDDPRSACGGVDAALSYLVDAASERPFSYTFEPPAGLPWESGRYEARRVRIDDARLAKSAPSLDTEGFVLVEAASTLRDFLDNAAVKERHYPEVVRLLLHTTGARQAFVFDHMARRREKGRGPLTFGRRSADGLAAANGRAHNDYTEASGRRRLGLVLGEAAEAARGRRFAIVNVWRSIGGPVLDTPLALCDARTVRPHDLVDSEVRYPHRTGEIYQARFSPAHRWSYFSRMDRHEALVFKQFDSELGGVPRFVPHAAFDHPRMPPDAPLRESIEMRCLIVY